MADYPKEGLGATEVVNQLTNIARQLSVQSQSIVNTAPAATTTSSPQATASNIGTTAPTTIVAASTNRHGLMMHNPATTDAYIWPSTLSPSPNTSSLAGTLLIAAGSTVFFSADQFPNVTSAFSAISTTGSAAPFTVWEFF